MKNNEYAIVAKNIKKSFGSVNVLDDVSLKVRRGTIMALLGPNGAGKTTTVRILSTLLRADAGLVNIEGHDATESPHKVRSLIGLTGQYAAVDEFLTGRENLHMMGRLYHLSKSDTLRRTEELLEQFDLKDAANRPSKTYSGGMRRRLDLAASIIATPPVIFLDEPTTGLDPRSRLAMWDIITQLTRQGSTILLTTQQLEEADHLADRIAVIDRGIVIAEGTADTLKQKVGKERIELVFADSKELKGAVKVISDTKAQIFKERHAMSIPNDGGVRQLTTLLQKLDKASVKVESLSLHKPTLDDVFLHLTGHQASKNNPDSNDSKANKDVK